MDVPSKDTFALLPLSEQIASLTRVDARVRQELIFSARNALDLARALPVELLLYTLKEIGSGDSVQLLALASPEQVRDLVDLDCWRKDHLDDRRLLTWLMLLDEAGGSKLSEWLLHIDIDLLVLLVTRHLEIVRKADVEEDLHFNAALYFTFDDQYLLRFVGEEQPILQLVLEQLRVLDYGQYRLVLEQSLVEFESALEEEALRWRTARLADRGYPSYDEAHEVFRFVAPESIRLEPHRRPTRATLRFARDEELIPPSHALALLAVPDSFFLRALSALPADDGEQIGQELAYLTNHTVVVEACDPGELSQVRACVELVHHYVNIGLAYHSQGDEVAARRLLHETQMHAFFHTGVSLTKRLQQQAKHLDATLRGQGIPRWQEYLDSPWRETCAGVLHNPPLFFLGLHTPGQLLYRRFDDWGKTQQVETLLTQIVLWFTVMQRSKLLSAGGTPTGVTLEILWNTAFARWITERTVDVQPLNRRSLNTLQQRLQKISLAEANTKFVDTAVTHFDMTADETAALHIMAAHAQKKLGDALSLDFERADLRFVEGLLVSSS